MPGDEGNNARQLQHDSWTDRLSGHQQGGSRWRNSGRAWFCAPSPSGLLLSALPRSALFSTCLNLHSPASTLHLQRFIQFVVFFFKFCFDLKRGVRVRRGGERVGREGKGFGTSMPRRRRARDGDAASSQGGDDAASSVGAESKADGAEEGRSQGGGMTLLAERTHENMYSRCECWS